jgi:hypothetical protein
MTDFTVRFLTSTIRLNIEQQLGLDPELWVIDANAWAIGNRFHVKCGVYPKYKPWADKLGAVGVEFSIRKHRDREKTVAELSDRVTETVEAIRGRLVAKGVKLIAS